MSQIGAFEYLHEGSTVQLNKRDNEKHEHVLEQFIQYNALILSKFPIFSSFYLEILVGWNYFWL